MFETDDHRRWGVQLSNLTWAALDSDATDTTSPVDGRDSLLYGAYASAYHWMQEGTPVNQARAEHLICRVATRIGDLPRTLHHAERCHELVMEHSDLVTD